MTYLKIYIIPILCFFHVGLLARNSTLGALEYLEKGLTTLDTQIINDAIHILKKGDVALIKEDFLPIIRDSIQHYMLHQFLGAAYLKLGIQDKAFQYIRSSASFVQPKDTTLYTQHILDWFGYYLLLKEKRLAKKYKNLAWGYYTHNSFEQNKILFENTIQYYTLIKDGKSAEKYIKKYRKYLGEQYNRKLNIKLDSLKFSLNRENQLRQEKDIIIQQRQAYQTKTIYAVLISIIFGLGIILLFFYFNIQKRKKLQETMLLEQQILRSQINADFIFQTLKNIRQLVGSGKNALATKYLGKFSSLLRITLDNSTQKGVLLEKEIKALENYITLQSILIDKPFNYIIKNEIETADIIIIPPMIIQPFVEYYFKEMRQSGKDYGILEIRIYEEQENIFCDISVGGVNWLKKHKNASEKHLFEIMNKQKLKYLEVHYNTSSDIKIETRGSTREDSIVKITIPHRYIL